jgi:ABC-type glycerol-3-phosphate transport system permease component
MTSAAQTASLIRRISRSEKYTAGRVIPEVLKYAIVVSLALSYAFPLYWMISSALKTDPQVYRIPPVLVPNPAQWVNFINAWKSDNFSLYTFNSIFRYALPYTLFTLLSSSIVAYGFSRIRWLGRDKLFYLCIGTMLIPYTVTMVPLFIIFKQLKWTGTYLPMIVPALFGNAFFIFMLRQFFMTLPEELSEAARIDGASELGIFFRVILPLAKPALAVVALFAFMGTWNDYLGPLIYINKYQMFPLALGIQKLRNMMSQVGNAPLAYPYLMAVSTIAAAPIIIIFFFAQRTFIEGIALTGLKG